MKLAFILGRKHSLALAEILEVLRFDQYDYEVLSVSNKWLIADIKSKTSIQNLAEKLQKRLGGTVKIVEILEEITEKELPDLSISLFEKMMSTKTHKMNIGVSVYGDTRVLPRGFQKTFGMSLKTYFEEQKYKARFVYGGDMEVSSVFFTKRLKDKGGDVNFLLTSKGKIYIGKTITAQDFEAYSERDYGRPMVSAKSGSLPPKLAQIMVNLATCDPEKHFYDAFCGSGTVLQEAMVLGYNVVGSDISRKAVQQSEQNLGWLKRHYLKTNEPGYQIFYSSIAKIFEDNAFVNKFIAKNKIGGAASEPYLGPTLQEVIRKDKNYTYMIKKISGIYQDIFESMPSILQTGQRFVFVLPAYKTTEGWETLEISELYETDFTKRDLLDTLPESDFGHIERELVWDRPQSIIRRHIVVLEKN